MKICTFCKAALPKLNVEQVCCIQPETFSSESKHQDSVYVIFIFRVQRFSHEAALEMVLLFC
jgi:hypothetical protein